MSEEESESESAETLPPPTKRPDTGPNRSSWVGLGVGVGVGIGSAALAAALMYATKKRPKK